MKLSALFFYSAALAIASAVSKRQFIGPMTQDDLINGTPCHAITIIFARGTFEVGNVGTLTGPPFFQVVADMVGASNVAVQGVDYPADVAGFREGGDPQGSQTMAQLVGLAQPQCPGTRIPGRIAIHNAAKILSQEQAQDISSVVIFGDPDNGELVANIPQEKALIICHPLDNICDHGDLIFPAHLTYAKDADEAAEFVVRNA